MAVAIVDGKPSRITAADFRRSYLAAFPKLSDPKNDPILDDAIEAVYIMFDGVNDLWARSGQSAWLDKTARCYTLLVAWYIANLYPRMAAGVQSTGGMPIKSKKIGDVTINYMDTSRLSTADAVLESLKSNPYGSMALLMIRGAPCRFRMTVIAADTL
jgi:hypothetical protein